MAHPQCSMIMAAYQAADTVEAAVRSCLAQEGVDVEVVVVDDGSTDGTATVVAGIADPRLHLVRLDENRGRSAARNVALAHSTAPVVLPCDADDVSRPGRALHHLRAFEAAPEAVVVAGRSLGVHPDGARPWPVLPATPEGVDRAFTRGRMGVSHPACAVRRSWIEGLGGYDEGVRVAEDFDLFLRGWVPGGFVPHPEIVLDYRMPGAFPSFGYWWDNERHRRAVVDRVVAGAAERDLDPFLRARSDGLTRAVESVRWSGALLLDRLRQVGA